jgi:hypothetical protein
MGALVPWGLARWRASTFKTSTWKVVKIDSPLLQKFVEKPYGVIISSDDMLARTHTAMFCLLVEGVAQGEKPAALEPWHVEVGFVVEPHQEAPNLRAPRLSTKLIFPAEPNEMDRDSREHGRLDAPSIAAASKMLKLWLPLKTGRL